MGTGESPVLAPSDGEVEIMYFGLESLRILSLEREFSGRPEGDMSAYFQYLQGS